jgi:hypothetical protein
MRSLLIILISIIFIVTLMISSNILNAASLYFDDFEDENYSGWSTSGGSWSIINDGTNVLKQSEISYDCYISIGSSWTNYSVQAKIKPLSFNGTDRPISLIVRMKDNSNFYFVRISNNNTIEIIKKVIGSTISLASKIFINTSTWYLVKFALEGNNLSCYVNDVL